ncbi:hypothetical protein OSTOST_24230 [Ostertagia ostertagi]
MARNVEVWWRFPSVVDTARRLRGPIVSSSVSRPFACALIVTGIEVVPLTDCDEGADDSIKSVSIPTGNKCGCKKFPFN